MPKIDFSRLIGGKKKKRRKAKAGGKKPIVKKSLPAKPQAVKQVAPVEKPVQEAVKQVAPVEKPVQEAVKQAVPVEKPIPKAVVKGAALVEKPVQEAVKQAAPAKKPLSKAAEKKLEKEISEFHEKPKAEREKASEGFDFAQITEQIKQRVGAMPSAGGFDEAAVAMAVATGEVAAKPPKKQKPALDSVLKRIPTGIRGLDELVEGGFEEGSTILVVGSAGTGKTLLALQFLYEGAIKYNEPGIFISFEEEKESLYRHSTAFGWDFKKLEKKKLFKVLEYKPHQVEKLMEAGGGPIRDQIKAMGAKRLVIDSITSYGLLFRDEYQKRENILEFFEMLRKWGCTSIIISELPPKVAEVKEGSVGFLTDAIISLYYIKEEDKGVRVHSCEILKMRGTQHTNKLLAVGFEKDGLVIYPEVEVF